MKNRFKNFKKIVPFIWVGVLCLAIGYGASQLQAYWNWKQFREARISHDSGSVTKAKSQPKVKKPQPVVKVQEDAQGDVLAQLGDVPPGRGTSPSWAKATIVLDDWGYNLDAFQILKTIPEPLTLAVLPALPYSQDIARDAHAMGKEIILHMPMEPKSRIPLEPKTIHVGMSQSQINQLLNSSLDFIPYHVGLNNHMGSKVTEDAGTMDHIMRVVKNRKVFFLDSMTGKSVGEEVAEKWDVPYLKRDIFLDNERTDVYVTTQLRKMIGIAKDKGTAIGIGHDEAVTLRAIQKMLPEFRRNKVELVTLQQMLKIKNGKKFS